MASCWTFLLVSFLEFLLRCRVDVRGGYRHISYSSVAITFGQEGTSRALGIETINNFQFDFFLEENLSKGVKMNLAKKLHDPIPERAFLPKEVAHMLPPLTTSNLPKLMQTFNIGEKTSKKSQHAHHVCPFRQRNLPAILLVSNVHQPSLTCTNPQLATTVPRRIAATRSSSGSPATNV